MKDIIKCMSMWVGIIVCAGFIMWGGFTFLDWLAPHIFNNAKVPTLRVGMCISESSREFAGCGKIMQITRIGKRNVMIKYTEGFEIEAPIDYVRKVYGEVECNCKDTVVWK